ncbi:MAG: hypothetical protein KY466_12370 [Gemmatimonadetes bacterium]|nr:hypothetical protein [Gemmatimonadota bacterium]
MDWRDEGVEPAAYPRDEPAVHAADVSSPRRSHGGWRLLLGAADRSGGPAEPPAADGATNMAIDRALLEAVDDGALPILRLYRWASPTLSFGRNQPARDLYDRDVARERGIAFVRRPTGGQAVLHADELTYAVAAPVAVIGKPRAAYAAINRALVAGLRALGVRAEQAQAGAHVGTGTRTGTIAGTHAHPSGGGWTAACFRAPAAGEVVVGGRKLVGSAQRCDGRVVLQHGSILISGTQATAEELLVGGTPAGPSSDPGWTTLEGELGKRPAWPALAAAIADGFAESIGTALAPARLSVEETTRVRELRVTFASPDWTWRR